MAVRRRAAGETGGRRHGPVKVGLVVPQSGVYAALGTDMQRGWELWLEQHGGKFGERRVETVIADEGETPQTGVPAVQKVLQSDSVDVVVGLVNSATALGVGDLLTESKKLLVVTNAGAADVTGKARTPYIWRTSFTNAQVVRGHGHPPRAVRLHRGRVRDRARLRRGQRGDRRLHGRVRGRRGQGRRPGQAAVRQDVGLPAVPHRHPAVRGEGHVLLLLRLRGHHLRQAVPAVRAGLHDPALRLRLPHRGQRAGPAGRRRARRADHAALHRPARQSRQQGLRRGLHGQVRRVPELLLGADLRRGRTC